VRNFVFVAVSILSLVNCRALADQVSLKNGDRLSGTIVKSDGKTLILHTNYADDINLKWDAIHGIQSSGELHLELQDGRSVSGTVTTSDGKLQIATRSGGTFETSPSAVKTLRNDAEQATYEKTVDGGILDDWKAGLNLGFSLTGGNSQTKNLSLAFTATRQTMHDKLGLYSNTIYATDDAPGATPSTSGWGYSFRSP
jgi:hypothetical protein